MKTLVFLPLILGLVAWILDGTQYWHFAVTLVTCFFVPYLFRDAMIRRLRGFLAVTEAVPYVIVVILLAFREFFLARPNLVLGFVCCLGIYIGAFFWVLSDRRVVSVRREGQMLYSVIEDSM